MKSIYIVVALIMLLIQPPNVTMQAIDNILGCESTSSDTANDITKMNRPGLRKISYVCNRSTPSDIPQNETDLYVEFYSCYTSGFATLPRGLFHSSRQLRRLTLSATEQNNGYQDEAGYTSAIKALPGNFLTGLDNLCELRLSGFENLDQHNKSRSTWYNYGYSIKFLKPLRNLRRLHLDNGFGAKYFTSADLGTILSSLENAPLNTIVLRDVRRYLSNDHFFDFYTVFNTSYKVTALTIDNSDIRTVSGRLSAVMPLLESVRISFGKVELNDPMVQFFLDALTQLHGLKMINIYGFPSITIPYDHTHYRIYDEDLMKFLDSMEELGLQDQNCMGYYKMLFSPSITSITLNGFEYLFTTGSIVDRPICLNESNSIVYLDMSNSLFQKHVVHITGLNRLEYLNLQNATVETITLRLVESLPNLRTLLLGRNNLAVCIATDYEASLFHSEGTPSRIKSLDLALCNLTVIPNREFRQLTELRFLNLSGNSLRRFDWWIGDCTMLSVLNLSSNGIEFLPSSFTQQLDNIATDRWNSRKSSSINTATALEVDLTGNNLSCLCNATAFVEWIQTHYKHSSILAGGGKEHISFIDLRNYTCLYPDGSLRNVLEVNVALLRDLCKPIDRLIKNYNNTDCPCDAQEFEQLQPFRFALSELRCRHPDTSWVTMSSLDDSESAKILKVCYVWYKSAAFVGSTVSAASLVIFIVMIIVFMFIYKWARPTDFEKMVKQLDSYCVTSALMRMILWERQEVARQMPEEEGGEGTFTHDVFIAYHPDEWEELTRGTGLIKKLENAGVRVFTEDNFLLGSSHIQELLKAVKCCRCIMLVLSPRFVADLMCIDIVVRAVQLRMHAILPIIYNQTVIIDHDTHPVLSNIVEHHQPIYWPEGDLERERIFNDIVTRLETDLLSQVRQSMIENFTINTPWSLL